MDPSVPIDAAPIDAELERIEALPLDQRPAALDELERRLRSALDEDEKQT